MSNLAAGIERKLLRHIAKKYPKPMNEIMYKPLSYPTEKMEHRQKTEKRLFQVLSQIPHWGVGRIVTSVEWIKQPPTFWRVTRVHVDHLTPEFEYGIAWGIFTDQGRSRGYEEEIEDGNEFLWRLVPKYEEQKYTNFIPQSKETKQVPLYVPVPPLMSRILKAEKNINDNDVEPMVRLLVNRGPKYIVRQRLDDGTLV